MFYYMYHKDCYQTGLVLLIGIIIILVFFYFQNQKLPIIQQTGGSNEYRVRNIIKEQSTIDFNYLRNVFDTKDKSFTLLLKLKFIEPPQPNDLIFKISKENLLNHNTIEHSISNSPIVSIDTSGNLTVKFNHESEPVVWKNSLKPETNYYLMLVANNGKYSLYDGNQLPVTGNAIFNLSSDIIIGTHYQKQENGLVTTITKIPTHSAILSLYYLSEALDSDYIRQYYDKLIEVMNGNNYFLPMVEKSTNETNIKRKEPLAIDHQISPKPDIPVVELDQRITIGDDILNQSKVIVKNHSCDHIFKQLNVFESRTDFTIGLMVKLNKWPIMDQMDDPIESINLINGNTNYKLNFNTNPCIFLESTGLLVTANSKTVENNCQFNHQLEQNGQYFYIIIFNNNQLSIVYDQKAVKFCNNHQKELFQTPSNLLIGSKNKALSDILVSLSYLPFALTESQAILHFEQLKQQLE